MKNKVTFTIIKILSFVVVFIISFIVISELMNKGNTDITEPMKKATLPLVYVVQDDMLTNCMHGYTSDIDTEYMRDSITALDEDRMVTIKIQKFQSLVQSIAFEVRSIDGERLIEHTQIEKFQGIGDEINATFTVKDLLSKNTEYILDIILSTDTEEQVHYYTRIMIAKNYHASEKLQFVNFFHGSTFDKEDALNITRYLESNYLGDNSTLGRVTINSSFNQITWADLKVTEVSKPILTVKELSQDTATIYVDNVVKTEEDNQKKLYRVREYYRVRYSIDRMYLLSYEREMNQIYNEKDDIYTSGAIMLGIQSESPDIYECDGGSVLAYIVEDRLFCYNSAENSVAEVFGFYHADDIDSREIYDGSDIKILSVDETGNIRFLVYGYMNSGKHEGNVGVCVYYYNSINNTIEEESFIQYKKSFALLKTDIEKLNFSNKENLLYLYLDCTIYKIDLNENKLSVIAQDISEENFKVSNKQQMLLIQSGKDIYRSTAMELIDLNTGKETSVTAGMGKYIIPLGFMEEDMVYGLVYQEDVVTDAQGETFFPIYSIRIQNELGEILKTYEEEGVYVTDFEISASQMVLSRVQRKEDGTYQEIEEDRILNNAVVKQNENKVTTPVTKTYEKIVQLNLKNEIKLSSFRKKTAKHIIYEGTRTIDQLYNSTENRFYVYGLKGLYLDTLSAATAITYADSISGVVMNDAGQYVWAKGNRTSTNQIMAIKEASTDETRNSLTVCLDTILSYEGIVRSTAALVSEGRAVNEILQKELSDYQVLDLKGCSLDMILYYLSKDIPVLALFNQEQAVLLIGYNSNQIVFMDPSTGTIYKKTKTATEELLNKNGNHLITYVKNNVS